jgi:hypothetical protein
MPIIVTYPQFYIVAWRHKAKLRAAGKINKFKDRLKGIDWDTD